MAKLQLRSFQSEFYSELISIRPKLESGEGHTITANCTPGGGKSLLASIALRAAPADYKLCWIVPRDSLRTQGVKGINSVFGKRIARGAAGESDVLRGMKAYVTTYQSVAANLQANLKAFRKHRFILIADEIHHLGPDSPWTDAVTALAELATLRVYASGTLERGDNKPVALVRYEGGLPAMESNDVNTIISYSRKDALAEGAIMPLKFNVIDASSAWMVKGERIDAASISDLRGPDARQALAAALTTEFSIDLINRCVNNWRASEFKGALLIVSPDIENAKKHLDHLKGLGIKAEIATSDNAPKARAAIRNTTDGTTDCLVSVGMAYEGLDIPRISHVALLTRIRSKPWLEQCFARANRRTDGKEFGTVFCPADVYVRDVVRMMEAEEMEHLRAPKEDDDRKRKKGADRVGILALESSANGDSEQVSLGETEYDIRSKIEKEVRQRAAIKGVPVREINREVMYRMRKSRKDMNFRELEQALKVIRSL